MRYILEVIGFNIESCVIAQDAGAGRIELCASPPEGGVTPSFAFIKTARKKLQIPLYVMVRPRGGDFLYSDEEFRIMINDIAVIRNLGCDGIVTGILTENGAVDRERCERLVSEAYPMFVTFHRAFDRVKEPLKALQDVIAVGYERILTSGLHPKVTDGLDMIKSLVKQADGKIIIMPGSGVTAGNIKNIIEETGVTEIHTSASASIPSAMHYLNDHMKESLHHTGVSEIEVKKMVAILKTMDASTSEM